MPDAHLLALLNMPLKWYKSLCMTLSRKVVMRVMRSYVATKISPLIIAMIYRPAYWVVGWWPWYCHDVGSMGSLVMIWHWHPHITMMQHCTAPWLNISWSELINCWLISEILIDNTRREERVGSALWWDARNKRLQCLTVSWLMFTLHNGRKALWRLHYSLLSKF